ncbi:MAG: hypothetical protein LBT80_07025 [Lactobacillaceae bacterium]|jgi:hypothetical protein|nr:hypothetical protein [Lactobacillaceae bacterium]
MTLSERNRKADRQWQLLFDELNITGALDLKPSYEITANKINEISQSKYVAKFGENAADARNILKFDFSVDLPDVFKQNKLAIFPIGHDTYKISDYKMYQKLKYEDEIVNAFDIPNWIVGLDKYNVTSEVKAQAVADISGMINHILEADSDVVESLAGKVGTGVLGPFNINTESHGNVALNIDGWQSEIDGIYETADKALIVEAKLKAPQDFNIRQLYIPMLIYQNLLKERGMQKEILCAYFIYTNETYIFNVYRFQDINYYNSLQLVKTYHFKIGQTDYFRLADLAQLVREVKCEPEPNIPFPQANNMYLTNELAESMQNDMIQRDDDTPIASGTWEAFQEVTKYDYDKRQSDYYYNFLCYLGFAHKTDTFTLSNTGRQFVEAHGGSKYRLLAEAMLKLPLYHDVLELYFSEHQLSIKQIVDIIAKQRSDVTGSTLPRRASSVKSQVEFLISNLDK